MIVISGALVLVALALLVLGLLDPSLPFVYASIAVCLLALLCLVLGVRSRRGEVVPDDAPGPGPAPQEVAAPAGAGEAPSDGAQGSSFSNELLDVGRAVPDDRTVSASAGVEAAAAADTPPADEAGAEDAETQRGDAPATTTSRRVPRAATDDEPGSLEDAGEDLEDDLVPDVEQDVEDDLDLDATVLVVSGRPRYHLAGCRYLAGRDAEPVELVDAQEAGFVPCGVCKPDLAVQDDTGLLPSAPEPDLLEVPVTEVALPLVAAAGEEADQDDEQ